MDTAIFTLIVIVGVVVLSGIKIASEHERFAVFDLADSWDLRDQGSVINSAILRSG